MSGNSPLERVRLSTRGSSLARKQTDEVVTGLLDKWPKLKHEIQIITTSGHHTLIRPYP